MDSSIVSQTTDTVVPPSTVIAHVSNHDADDENGNELARTRRRHSQGTCHDHPGLARPTCEAVRRRRGCACVAPRQRCPSGGAGFDTSGRSVRVCGLCNARDGFHRQLLTTGDIVHARVASCGRPILLQGWVPGAPLTVLRGAYRGSSPASSCAVERRNRLTPGLGEHHGYPLGTPCAWERVARPSAARVRVRAPSAISAAKGYLFKG